MPRQSLLTTALLLPFVAAMFACHDRLPTPGAGSVMVRRNGIQPQALIRGRVQMPTPLATRATVADIARSGDVVLLEGNVTRAAGLTDGDGRFQLFQGTDPFTPVEGAIYRLEARKQMPGAADNPILSLRTLVRRVGTGWESITAGGEIVLNMTTTVLSDLQEDPGNNLTQAQLIGAVSGGLLDTIAPALGLAAPTVTEKMNRATDLLTSGLDPVAHRNVVYYGDVNMNDERVYAKLRFVERIEGSVTLEGWYDPQSDPLHLAAIQDLSLPFLKTITGSLSIIGARANAFSLPALKTIGGGVSIVGHAPANQGLIGDSTWRVSIPAVQALTSLSMDNTLNLTALNLQATQSIGNLTLNALQNCQIGGMLPNIQTIDSFTYSGPTDNGITTAFGPNCRLRNSLTATGISGSSDYSWVPELTGTVTLNLQMNTDATSLDGLRGTFTLGAMTIINRHTALLRADALLGHGPATLPATFQYGGNNLLPAIEITNLETNYPGVTFDNQWWM